jgi:hypothetical protein
MKKILVAIVLSVTILAGFAQNVQLHYDLGKARNGIDRDKGFFTSTIEMYRPDQHGSFFFFSDMDFNGNKGVSRAYMEFARNISIGKFPLQARVEYNGGLVLSDTTRGNSIATAWLFGVNYPFKIGSKSFGTYLVYKHIANNTQGPDFQWTLNWNIPIHKAKFSFNGFLDIWSTDKQSDGKKLILLTEPQLWFNTGHYASLGSELEISRNFYPWMDGFRAFPTLALKITFNK